MQLLFSDLRHALRVLAKKPIFALISILTLAAGIGANTAVFSVFNAVLLRPLPYQGAQDIVTLWEKRSRENVLRSAISAPDFVDWRRMAKSFSSMGLYDTGRYSLTGNGDPERVPGVRVTAGFFESLSVRPRLGRTFEISEEQPGHHREAIITFGLWQRRFGSDAGILGKTVGVNGEPFTIIGVLARDFRFPFAAECDLFVPVVFTEEQLKFRGIHSFLGVGRLKPGVSLQQAQAEMDLISKQLEQQNPDSNIGHGANIIALRDEISGKLRPALLVLLGAVFLVVLIACANVANLLLARAAARRKEMAVRAALGSSRWRLVQQSLAESVLLALCGSAAGVLIAMWGLDVLRMAFFNKIEYFSLAGLDSARIDWRVLLFTLATAVASTLFFGIAPAVTSARVDLNEALRSGGRGATAFVRGRLRSALVVVEVALSLILLMGAGLLGKSFAALLNVNPGFQPERLLAAGITLPRTQYRTTEQAANFYDTLLERVRALPGLRSAAITDTVPLSGDDNRIGILIEGRTPRPGERFRAHPRLVSAGYLETMGIALLQGRTFTGADMTASQTVVIVSETAARQFWPDGHVLGKRFAFDFEKRVWLEVIGVAAAVHNRALDQESTPDVYLPYRENPFRFPPTSVALMLRTEDNSSAVASAVRATVATLDRALPVSNIQTMESYIADSLAPKKFNFILLGVFAILALGLAAAGLYGMMSYLVSQRTGEIGIRMALGARQGDVLRMVIGDGLVLCGTGVAIGLAASFAATRVMASLLFGVRPLDPLVFSAVPAMLIAVGALASWVPARRASSVEPLAALRID